MAIDDLVERHLRVAGHALRMFVSLRPHATDEQAKQSAIRRAGVVFHLNTSPAQDSPVPGQRPARPPEPGSRSPRLAPGGQAEGGPAPGRQRLPLPGPRRGQRRERSPGCPPGRRALPRQPAGPPPLTTSHPAAKEERAMPPSRAARDRHGASGEQPVRGRRTGADRPGPGEPACTGGDGPAHGRGRGPVRQ
jgi:hypothetical protein